MMKALTWLATVAVVVGIGLAPVLAGTTQEQGKHSMSGTISAIDHTAGLVILKTGAGELKLHFPPPTIQKLKEGDTITVHLSYAEGGAAR
jgi:hypothetical protein